MKALLQRVSRASVTVDGVVIGEVGAGLMILLGVQEGDGEKEADFLADKTAGLRIFEDEAGKMNRSLLDVGGEALVVSQFTLCADARKGRRPSFIKAMKPPEADRLYRYYTEALRRAGVRRVATGEFGAMMQVEIHNDGPVTILLDTDEIMKS